MLLLTGHPRTLFHSTFFLLAVCCLPAAGQTVTVSADDPRITYQGTWVDQDNGGHKYAGGAGSSLSFAFNGTAIYYHSVINPNGGVAQLSLDSGPGTLVDESASAHAGAAPIPAVLWSATALAATQAHTLSVSYVGAGALGGAYVEIYSLAYVAAALSSGGPAPTVSSEPAAAATTGASAASGTSGPSAAQGPTPSTDSSPGSAPSPSPSEASGPGAAPSSSATSSPSPPSASTGTTTSPSVPRSSASAAPSTSPIPSSAAGAESAATAGTGSTHDTAAIAAGVLGAACGVALAMWALLAWRRRGAGAFLPVYAAAGARARTDESEMTMALHPDARATPPPSLATYASSQSAASLLDGPPATESDELAKPPPPPPPRTDAAVPVPPELRVSWAPTEDTEPPPRYER